jgi:hypothetical protein
VIEEWKRDCENTSLSNMDPQLVPFFDPISKRLPVGESKTTRHDTEKERTATIAEIVIAAGFTKTPQVVEYITFRMSGLHIINCTRKFIIQRDRGRNRNRKNVTSRSGCLCSLYASPPLRDPSTACQMPNQSTNTQCNAAKYKEPYRFVSGLIVVIW